MKRTLYWRNPEKNYAFEKMGEYDSTYGIVVILVMEPPGSDTRFKVYTINQHDEVDE